MKLLDRTRIEFSLLNEYTEICFEKKFIEMGIKIEKVDNGLMAIKGLKGNNKIRFSYFPPGLKEGIVVSIVSFLIYISIIFLMVKKEK